VTVLDQVGAQGAQSTLDFAGLVEEHQSMVFSVAYHFLHDRAAAEEVAQEVFFSLHRHMRELQSPAHAAFWLRKVAVQRSLDEARRRKRRPQISLESVAEPAASAGGTGGPAGAGRDPMLHATLQRLIASLPETPRMIMILRYQEDLDPSEIAATLQMPVGTVKSHLQRSLALLREKLRRRGAGEFGWTG
jgi:RNA polymerase sigma-70 factor, ECF subfamily